MLYKQLIELFDILDSASASGAQVVEYFRSIVPDCQVETYPLEGPKGHTDMVRILIPGRNGKSKGGSAKTMGILGRLGGLGARPEQLGFVSDGDGALTALAVAAKLLDMQKKGDFLEGDVFISTHVCPDAPTTPHEPVPFMNSPVETWQVNKEEVTDDLDAVLVVDTTKGNRIINHRGFAISPTVKEGYILRVSEDLLDVMISTTGRLPHVFCLKPAGYHSLRKRPVPLKQHFTAGNSHQGPGGRRGSDHRDHSGRLCHRSYPSGGPGGCRTVYAGGSQGLWKWSVLLLR